MTDVVPSFEYELTTKDGRKFKVPAEKAPIVQRRWDEKQPIHFADESINYHDIVSFNKVAKTVVQSVPLLEGVAQAFDEPMYNEDGEVKWKWVKMQVSQREYSKFYSVTPGYKSLDGDGGLVTVAFKQPVHQIDPYKTELCNQEEITRLQ